MLREVHAANCTRPLLSDAAVYFIDHFQLRAMAAAAAAARGECPHLAAQPKPELQALLERATGCAVRGCATAKDDLLVCLQPGCSFIGCGDAGARHAPHHSSSMSHATLVAYHTGRVTCAVCGTLAASPTTSAAYNVRN